VSEDEEPTVKNTLPMPQMSQPTNTPFEHGKPQVPREECAKMDPDLQKMMQSTGTIQEMNESKEVSHGNSLMNSKDRLVT
jgi:hypothetical protein